MLLLKHRVLLFSALLALATGLVPTVHAASATDFACSSPLQSFSNLERMQQGDFTANVKWKDVRLTPTSIGYGPGEDHRFELTVLDGRVYMARPGENDRIIVRNDPKPDEGAAMLQIASPPAWKAREEELDALNSFDDLNFEMEQVAEDLGCGDDVLLPFKIEGHAQSVTWSMDTRPSRVVTSRDQDVVIVGLYNRNDKSRYFMVRGYDIHPHVVMPTTGYAGHLRDIQLDEGARLYLPTR